MRKKNFKGRCVKRTLGKCNGICRTYDEIQFAYADVLQKNDSIKGFSCNIPLDNSEYMTDFVCVKNDGSVKDLSNDEKIFRWALNKYYYTKRKNSLKKAYTLMLKDKYTDGNGNLPITF